MKKVIAVIFLFCGIGFAQNECSTLGPGVVPAWWGTYQATNGTLHQNYCYNIVTGQIVPSSYPGYKNISGRLVVDSVNSAGWAGANVFAWINSAMASCPAAPSGCEIYVTGFQGTITGAGTTIAISKPVHLIFGPAHFIYNGTGSSWLTCTNADSVIIEGAGSRMGGSQQGGLEGTIFEISTASPTQGILASNCFGLYMHDFFLLGGSIGTVKGMVLSGGEITLARLLVQNFTSHGIELDSTTNNSNSGYAYQVMSMFNAGGHGFFWHGPNSNNWVFSGTTAGTNGLDGYNFNGSQYNVFVGALSQFNVSTVGFRFVASVGNSGSIYSEPSVETTTASFDGTSNWNHLYFNNGVAVVDNGNGNEWEFGNSAQPPTPNIRHVIETMSNNDTAFNPMLRFSRRQVTVDACDTGMYTKSATSFNGYMLTCQQAMHFRYGAAGSGGGVNYWNNIADANIGVSAASVSIDGMLGPGLMSSGIVGVKETSAPAGAASSDLCYGDSTLHALKCNYNNTAFNTVPLSSSNTTNMRFLNCGTTTTCAQTNQGTQILINGGPIALVAGTLTITSLPFTSSTSYVCSADDSTGINGIDVVYVSGSSVTFNGTGTDSIRYQCQGN